MCYDSKTSALSATIGILSAWVAFHINEPVLGCLIIVYSLMQIAEFCIWHGLDTNSFQWNQWGTTLASTSLKLHAIVVVAAILIFKWKTHKQNQGKRIALQIILVIAFFVCFGSLLDSSPPTTQPSCSKGCRLEWKFGASYPIQIVLIGAAFIIGVPEIFIPIAVFYLGALFVSMGVSFMDPKTTFKTAISSIWCFFVALFAPLLVGYLWWKKQK